jgi:hypothetical protein
MLQFNTKHGQVSDKIGTRPDFTLTGHRALDVLGVVSYMFYPSEC